MATNCAAELAIRQDSAVLEQGILRGQFHLPKKNAQWLEVLLLTMKRHLCGERCEATWQIRRARRVRAVSKIAEQEGAECLVICAQLEAELVALPAEERLDYLKSVGVTSSGVDRLIKNAYHLLGLMSFLTAGEKEVRAWTIPQNTRAQQAAGVIHSDIERGFIRAEIVSYDDLFARSPRARNRDSRTRGHRLLMQEGDVVIFALMSEAIF